MNANNTVVLLLSLALFFAGLAVSYLFQLPLEPISLNIHPAVDMVVLVSLVFVLSMLFFGQLAPTVMLLLGLMYGRVISTDPLLVLLAMVPSLLAVHIGSITGRLIYRDLEGQENLFEKKRRIVLQVAAAVGVAIVFGFAVWAVNLLGITQQYILPAMLGAGLPF